MAFTYYLVDSNTKESSCCGTSMPIILYLIMTSKLCSTSLANTSTLVKLTRGSNELMVSSISDLICKGVKPEYYFISGSGNKNHFTKKNLKMISKSLNEEQKKYNLKLSGGDTVTSKKISFSITTIGFSSNIIERNKARLNDDIYVTGNIGDSFLGLQLIKKKIKISSKLKNYFINQFYCPNLPHKIYKEIYKFANTSMDVSDGLISDMFKLINKQKLSFEININKIPISNMLKSYLKKHNKKKINFLFKGDDYQILFTSSKKNRKLIKNISKKMNQKITLIGKINNKFKKNSVLWDKKPTNLEPIQLIQIPMETCFQIGGNTTEVGTNRMTIGPLSCKSKWCGKISEPQRSR